MPSKLVEAYARESGKTVAEVEAIWEKCKESAAKYHEKDSDEFYAYTNMCTRTKLGLGKKKKKDKGKK